MGRNGKKWELRDCFLRWLGRVKCGCGRWSICDREWMEAPPSLPCGWSSNQQHHSQPTTTTQSPCNLTPLAITTLFLCYHEESSCWIERGARPDYAMTHDWPLGVRNALLLPNSTNLGGPNINNLTKAVPSPQMWASEAYTKYAIQRHAACYW